MTTEANIDQATAELEHETLERLDHTINEWRDQIDELLVQLDLGTLNVHDEVHRQLEIAENACLIVQPQPAGASADVKRTVSLASLGIEKLISDLRVACRSVEEVVRPAGRS
jgi:hypothetical protein